MDMMNIKANMPLRRGVIYGRVSTNNDGQKSSLKYQTEMFDEYADRNNIFINRVYAEVGSGTSITKRKEFKQLLEDANLGLFDCILTKDVSRWSRDNLGFLETVRNLKKLGIIVYFVDIGLNSEDDEMTLSILAAVAQKEALNTRAKTKSVRRYQVEHGAVPCIIFGYDKIKGSGAYNTTINTKEAAIVQQIFEMYANGIGAQNICRALTQAGIKTKRGTDFSVNNIHRMLRNKIYIGIVQNNKQESLDKRVEREVVFKGQEEWLEHERPDLKIVEPETFYKCQDILDLKSKIYKGPDRLKTGWNLPFSKILVCSECGSAFRRNKSGRYTYFKCNTHIVADIDRCANDNSIREDDLYNEVKVYMIALLKQRENIEGLIERKLKEKLAHNHNVRTEDEIKSELAKLKKQKERAMDLYIDGNDELKPKIDKLTKRISSLEAEMSRVNNSSEYNKAVYNKKIAGLFDSIEEFVNSADIRDLDGERFNQMFDSIKVHKDGHLTINLALCGQKKSLNSVYIRQ